MEKSPKNTDWIFSPVAVEESLKKIAGQVITAHRQENLKVLVHYAKQAGIEHSSLLAQPNKLFMKVIQVFHPDRAASFIRQVRESPEEARLKLAGILTFTPFAEKEVPRKIEYEAGPESYGYGEEDFGYDEAPYYDTDFDDYGDIEDDYLTGDPSAKTGLSFLQALKREILGNLDLWPGPADLEQLEGELDLSDCAIFDLEGAEYCKNLLSLNLSSNNIDNVYPLSKLVHLEFLDLSCNCIDDADSLGSLDGLTELDLSENEIEDIRFLEKLSRLTYVNLLGNPVTTKETLKVLKSRGVLVLH